MTAIQFNNISKKYRLGEIGTGTFSRDLERAWARMRGKEDPFAKVGETNDREVIGGEFVWALRDINFNVEAGEILGIVGKNGAGKSTLLKILSRVTAPSTGSIKAKGKIASLLEVGTGFHPELTGRENIYLNGTILGMRRHEITTQINNIIDFSGCGKFIDTPVKRYSSGMTVRLGFAVAAHLNCEILVVDEVLAVGDLEFQKKCLGKISEVSSDGKTVLFVSHNLGAVASLCSRCVLFNRGELTMDATPDAVVREYEGTSMLEAKSLKSRFVSGIRLHEDKNTLVFGTKLAIDIQLREIPRDKIGLNLIVKNQQGLQIFLFSTQPHDGFDIGPTQSEERVSLSIPSLRLAPGTYFVSLEISDPGISILESHPDCLLFHVSPKVIGGNWPYESRFGTYFPDHFWSKSNSPNRNEAHVE